jgi:flap endonuclease-1
MLKLMGMPIIEAPGEAEATCAILCKAGKVFATATEDLDALTFGTKILLRGFNSKKEPITEVNRDEMMKVIIFIDFKF